MMALDVGFGALLIAACCSDVLKLRIPNAIPLLILLLFGVKVLVAGAAGLGSHAQAMLVALAILVPLFALDMLGGGDVKLLASVALWLGMADLAVLLISVGIAGGVFALVWLPLRRLVVFGLPRARLPDSLAAGAPLPFALPITIIAIPLTVGG